jgi:phospholipase/lecithinase/hemolysin
MLFPTLILALATNAVVAAPHQAGSASATPKTLVVFGDSYSDNCNTWRMSSSNATQRMQEYPHPACPPFPIGRAGGGPSWPGKLTSSNQHRTFAYSRIIFKTMIVEFVANQSSPQISVINHAYSAATCSNLLFPRNIVANGANVSIPDVGQQIDIFLKNDAAKLNPAETEIVIFIGTNDLTFFVAPAHAETK